MNITAFKGLNNVSDPLRVGLGWLTQADNVNITDTGGLTKRSGYSLTQAGAYTGAYSTIDFSRMYVAVDGAIKDFVGDTLVALASAAPMYWCEVNDQVFFNNGTDRGVIMPDNSVLAWDWPTPSAPSVAAVTGGLPAGLYQVRCTYVLADGRETGTGDSAEIMLVEGQALQISPSADNTYIAPANSGIYQLAHTGLDDFVFNSSPDNLGRDLQNAFLDPLPADADVIQTWKGRMYAAMYMAAEDQTAIWFSEPLAYHLFNLNSNFFLVPGRVLMLAPHDDLIIGTDKRIYAYSGEKLSQLAPYGVVPGQHWSWDDDRILFWTARGLCAALPFSNLTERQVSVAPGVHAGGCVVRNGGQKRFVVALQQGGSAFNSYP